MSITQSEARALLKDLSCSKGGSILGKVEKHKLNDNSRILFIGIGGLGCQTINRIKGVYKTKFEQTPDVKFLCLDTDEDDVRALKTDNGGNITVEEMFELYDSSSKFLLVDRPAIVRDWLSDEVPSEEIKETGAKSRRVVGRVLLCGTGKYAALEDFIRTKIKEFTPGGIIEVVICSGISGGTGSGTFIDVSYMVRMILSDLAKTNFRSTNLYGIFFTPDVQKTVKGIGDEPDVWKTIQQNGYAAMKELSYFMNLGSDGFDQNVYSLRVIDPAGGERICSKPIFERGYAFMISATPEVDNCEDLIGCTAEAVLNMFRPGRIDPKNQTKSQSILSTLCNIGRNVGTWETETVGIEEPNLAPDPCGIKNTYFPVFMNNSFSSFGYRSVYLPKNEMAAYIANISFKAIIEKYKQAFNLTNDDALYIAQCLGISSVDELLKNIKEKKGISANSFRVEKSSPKYPKRFGTELIGKVSGMEDTIKEAAKRAENKIETMTGLGDCVDGITHTVKQLLEGEIPFLTNSGEMNLWEEFGPFGANVILAGTDSSGTDTIRIKGIIDILTDLKNTLFNAQADINTVLEEKQANLKNAEIKLQKDHGPHDDEIETFIDACEQYSDAYFDSLFIENYMGTFIDEMIKGLRQYSNETFEIYTPIIMGLSDILNEDSDIFVHYYLNNERNRSVFSLNALNIGSAMEKNNIFANMFSGMVEDETAMASIKENMVNLLFSSSERNNWAKYVKSPEMLCEKLRKVFSSTVEPLVKDQLEKFVVLVYGNRNQIVALNNGNPNVDIKDLNKIWDDSDLRKQALHEAAKKIVEAIAGSALIAFDGNLDTSVSSKFEHTVDVVLLEETPNLNKAIEDVLMGDPTFKNKYSTSSVFSLQTEISAFECIRPFSLEMVRYMQDYAKEYFNSEKLVGNSAGRHLNEVSEEWQRNLPEIYGKDTEDYFRGIIGRTEQQACIPDASRRFVNGKIYNNDVEVYEEIREAVEYGIEKGYIAIKDGKYQICILKDTSPEFIHRLENEIVALSDSGLPNTWIDALESICNQDNRMYHEWIRLDRAIVNDGLKSRQTNEPASRFEWKNVYRIVRADMVIHKLVIDWYNTYKELNLFNNLSQISSFSVDVEYFIKANQCGMISYDPKKGWFCTYSDNKFEEPILFFEDYKKKNEALDVPFTHFLVFSAFVSNALTDIVKESIDQKFDDLQKATKATGESIPSCKNILDEMRAGFETQMFTVRDAKQKEKAIGMQLSSTLYWDMYNTPKQLTSKNDVTTFISNLKAFVSALETLEITGRL